MPCVVPRRNAANTSPCALSFWMCSKTLLSRSSLLDGNQGSDAMAAYFPLGEEKTSRKSIALTRCVNDVNCGSSSQPCCSGCLWCFPAFWISCVTAENHVLWVFFPCALAKLLGANRRTWQLAPLSVVVEKPTSAPAIPYQRAWKAVGSNSALRVNSRESK